MEMFAFKLIVSWFNNREGHYISYLNKPGISAFVISVWIVGDEKFIDKGSFLHTFEGWIFSSIVFGAVRKTIFLPKQLGTADGHSIQQLLILFKTPMFN